MATVAILPVKRFDHAKQRLRDELADEEVRQLVESMLSKVLVALTRVSLIELILVVSRDPIALGLARQSGAVVIDDDERGHNAAARSGIEYAQRRGAERVLLVPGDCPLLDPEELEALIAQAATEGPEALIVPDRHGTGTNALLLTPPDALEPSFGPDSCQRHLASARSNGIDARVLTIPSLALDIDTPEDLATLRC